MQRFFVPAPLLRVPNTSAGPSTGPGRTALDAGAGTAGASPAPAALIDLPDHIARQITTVLRMRPGERVRLFDGTGAEWEVELTDVRKAAARARVVGQVDPAREPARRVTLCQALLKGEKMEWVLQKGTELGIAAFQPVLSERVVAQKAATPERWRRIVIEAAEQSGRTRLPELHEPVPLAKALSEGPPAAFCWEEERSRTLPDLLGGLSTTDLRLFIGPEGGFTAAEAEGAREAGAESVSLGPLTLRAETAAIAASTLALLAP